MKKLFQIKRVITNAILFEVQAETFKDAVQAACDAGVDLSRANFEGQDLTGLEARGINFRRVWLKNAVISNATFDSCCLDNAMMNSVVAQRTKFPQSTLTDVDATDADLTEASVATTTTGGILAQGATFTNLIRDSGSEPDLPTT